MTSESNPVRGYPSRSSSDSNYRRWFALCVLCLGVTMIMVDATVVNVALPSIKTDLNFTDTHLAWIVNAYFLFFGGFLLLAGRLGDIYGHRRLFLFGIGLFTLASLACGLATNPIFLVAARAIQGFGGAIVSAVALSLIMALFQEPADRAKAMGAYGFVCASGSSLGAILGGVLTSWLGWEWIFLINLPIGIAVIILSLRLLDDDTERHARPTLDYLGAVLGTGALMLAVYAIVNSNEQGWTSAATLGCAVAAGISAIFFLVVEAKVAEPLVPLALFRKRSVSIGNIVVVFWAAALFTWFFQSSLYLQLVLGYTPLQVGLSFLPANMIMAVFSLVISGPLIKTWGIRWPMVGGLLVAGSGLLLFAIAPVDGRFLPHVLPAMCLFGVGAGTALNPMLMAATNGVAEADAGLASGLVNTSFAMGGSLWLAVLTSLAARTTQQLASQGVAPHAALNGGYSLAFLAAASCTAIAAVLGATRLGSSRPSSA